MSSVLPGRLRSLPLLILPAVLVGPAVAAALPPQEESVDDRPALPDDEPVVDEGAGEESEGEGEEPEPAEERITDDGRDDEGPTRAEARLVEQLSLGTSAIVHRLTAPGGVTARYLRAAGGERRPSWLSYPVPGGRLARGYGSGTNGRHKALDVIADQGTSIRAAERGLVIYADNTIRGYGWMAVLLHPGGWVTFYAHCKKLLVHPGQTVERREVTGDTAWTVRARGKK